MSYFITYPLLARLEQRVSCYIKLGGLSKFSYWYVDREYNNVIPEIWIYRWRRTPPIVKSHACFFIAFPFPLLWSFHIQGCLQRASFETWRLMPKFWWLKFNGVVSVDAFALTIGKSSCEFFIAICQRRLWSLEPSMHKELKGGVENLESRVNYGEMQRIHRWIFKNLFSEK